MPDREALQAAMDAFGRGDVEEMVRRVDPEFEGVVPPELSAEPDSYFGPDGVRRYFALFEEIVDGVRFAPTVIEEVGDWTLLEMRLSGIGRTSGLAIEATVVSAVLMRGDKVLRMQGYRTVEEARAAVA
jgi:ketosteroid isomerase-like protein